MSRRWKLALILAVILILAMSVSLAWSAPQSTPVFSEKDRALIRDYYKEIAGTLAPASIDRSPFPFGVEESMKAGARVPVKVEKEMTRLPSKLESQLSSLSGNYGRYALGNHVVLVKREDMTIVDILKNVALK